MREYTSGTWGFALIWGLRASVFPRAIALAIPNALIALILSIYIHPSDTDYDLAKDAFSLLAGFTTIMSFVLGFRSNIAYRRWWEGGTLLQQTRGEWFNAYSSLIAFASTDQAMETQVEAYQHMLVRFMSLLFCSALQQVSPDKETAFEIVNTDGIDPESIRFLRQTNDQVEVILQWIQRSTVLNAASGVLTAPPPILSRAFQEISRGIVNLQNARKIADFPFPFPYAQTSIVMLLIHWALCPILACTMLQGPWAALVCFLLIFFLWCINYIAFDLENPFGTNDNDLPMAQFQTDWNKSLVTLLAKRAQQPPAFAFVPAEHRAMAVSMSDGRCSRKRRMSMSEHLLFGNDMPAELFKDKADEPEASEAASPPLGAEARAAEAGGALPSPPIPFPVPFPVPFPSHTTFREVSPKAEGLTAAPPRESTGGKVLLASCCVGPIDVSDAGHGSQEVSVECRAPAPLAHRPMRVGSEGRNVRNTEL